ncbi:MAG: [Fe-Fe] hydrogenase large subunit C-terminal domain-containing protein [bacterium]
MNYFHSVKLIEEECKGCTHCIRTCPTEAIRVRNGKATIINERCIDCGECIRTCPNSAKIAISDAPELSKNFKYNIAIPAPSFAGQFTKKYPLEKVLSGFLHMGFDEVLEVGFGAALMARAITEYLREQGVALPRPVISSACPAVVRLVQVKFPGLVENILPMQSPMEMTAQFVREHAREKLGLKDDEIGVFFISPCPAKVTVVKQPIGFEKSSVSGVIGIKDMVNFIKKNFNSIQGRADLQKATSAGIGWGRRGGEVASVDVPNKMEVDGIHHVSRVLEKIEEGGFKSINFIEAQACTGGCVGGVLQVENPFLSMLKIDLVADEIGDRNDAFFEKAYKEADRKRFFLTEKIEPRSITSLDGDVGAAMRKLKEIEALHAELPGIDCGSCGCPTCRAFAEDVTAGLMMRMDCLFDLRERVRCLAEEIFSLAQKLPHAMKDKDKGVSDETQ